MTIGEAVDTFGGAMGEGNARTFEVSGYAFFGVQDQCSKLLGQHLTAATASGRLRWSSAVGNGSATVPWQTSVYNCRMQVTTTPDLLDEGFYADLDGMHEAFTCLRRTTPSTATRRPACIGVTRHADVLDVERRAEVFVSSQGYRSIWSPDEDNMIAQDDPGHAEQRALVARRLTPQGVERDEALLASAVDELLDAVADAGEIEVVDALAAQLPVPAHRATSSGSREDRWRDLKTWSERLMRIDSIPRRDRPRSCHGRDGGDHGVPGAASTRPCREFREEPDRRRSSRCGPTPTVRAAR